MFDVFDMTCQEKLVKYSELTGWIIQMYYCYLI